MCCGIKGNFLSLQVVLVLLRVQRYSDNSYIPNCIAKKYIWITLINSYSLLLQTTYYNNKLYLKLRYYGLFTRTF